MPLFGHKHEEPAPQPSTTSTSRTSTSSTDGRRSGLFSSRRRSSSPDTVITNGTRSSGGSRNLLHRNQEDSSITAARQRVIAAEHAEREADKALAQARSAVRDAMQEVKNLEREAAEEARLAKIKQKQAGDISKRAKPLGLCLTVSSGVVLFSANAQVCSNASTAIGGKPFPSLIDATTEDLVTGLESGLFTSVDLVNAYIARIMEVNSTLRMVTELNPDALSIASQLDSARANGTVYGPLHGIPILIKNNIATDDKMNNTAGSYALLGAKVPRDSTIAAKLRKAGAIILGKTNLSQWANYRSDNTSNGWSAYGGQTEAAYYPGQDPSGSSSGSGVASSLGLALAALGTETDGSILSPSNVNNLVGIKPSVGLTSRYLVIPISEHQDTVGPMARTVKDAAYVLSAITGKDPYDNYTSAIPFNKTPDYVGACDYFALRGKRIGVPRNLIDLGDDSTASPIIPVFNSALDVLRSAGATVVDNITLPGYERLATGDYSNIVLEADFVSDLHNYLTSLTYNPYNITTLSQLQDFTQSFPLESFPTRDTEVWTSALSLNYNNTSPLFWTNYTTALYLAGPLGILGGLRNHSLDALVVPTDFSPFLPALIGSPVITVPLGKYPANTTVVKNNFGNLNATAPNVPFGISFMAERFSEEKLIGLAYAFEQRTKVRDEVRPYLWPSTEVRDVLVGT